MNPYEIDECIYCGPRPSFEEDVLNIATWANLEKLSGIHTMLDLSPGPAQLNEATFANRFNIRIYTHAFTPVMGPTAQKVWDALKFLSAEKKAQRKTFFYCRNGRDMTGIIRAAYRIKKQDWSVDDATNEMYCCGFNPLWVLWTHVLNEI